MLPISPKVASASLSEWGRKAAAAVNGLIATLGDYLPLTGGTLTGDLNVPDEVYGAGWNGSLEVPTKNALYDKIETISAGAVADADYGDIVVSGGVWSFDTGVVTAFAKTFLDDANAGAVRTTLGLGTLATQSGTFSGTSSGTNTGDQTITLTGDATGTGTGSFATTLATVNANVGSFGSATAIPVVTVNAKGLITAVTTATPAVAFRGALVRKAVDQTAANYTTATALAWTNAAAVYDTSSIWSSGANTRLSVPSGVTRVRLKAQVSITNLTSGLFVALTIRKNGSSAYDGYAAQFAGIASTFPVVSVASPVLTVAGGTDYFEAFLIISTDTSVTVVAAESWFAMEIIE